MPEAPKVEIVARALRPLVRGRRIRGCRMVHPVVVPAAQRESLGPDALSTRFSPAILADIFRGSDRPVKLVLTDQKRIAGIGNIYCSEPLWRSRLGPRRRADSLRSAKIRRLHKAVVSVLKRALECCRNPSPDFRDPEWWFAGLDRILAVYERKGEPCRRFGCLPGGTARLAASRRRAVRLIIVRRAKKSAPLRES